MNIISWGKVVLINFEFLSILVFPQLWDTDIIFTEYAQNPSHVPDVCLLSDAEIIVSSPRRVSFDRRWNYWLESQSTRVPDVCPSTDAETIELIPSLLSFERCRNHWLTSQPSVLQLSQPLMIHVLDVCPPTVSENKMSPFVSTTQN